MLRRPLCSADCCGGASVASVDSSAGPSLSRCGCVVGVSSDAISFLLLSCSIMFTMPSSQLTACTSSAHSKSSCISSQRMVKQTAGLQARQAADLNTCDSRPSSSSRMLRSGMQRRKVRVRDGSAALVQYNAPLSLDVGSILPSQLISSAAHNTARPSLSQAQSKRDGDEPAELAVFQLCAVCMVVVGDVCCRTCIFPSCRPSHCRPSC